MQYNIPFSLGSKNTLLPPLHVKRTVKKGKKWRRAVMDAFEFIGYEQLRENLEFWDFFRMTEGEMSYQELRETIPHLKRIEDFLHDDLEIPSWLKHYDLLGPIENEIVGRYVEYENKYHLTETGELFNNEFLRFKNEQLIQALSLKIDAEVKLRLAQRGLTEEGKQFQSEQERQAYIQQIEKAKAELIPQETKSILNEPFKTAGMKWGKATLEKDYEGMNFPEHNKESLKQYFKTGRWFRERIVNAETYTIENWDSRNTFFSKEINAKYPQKLEYCGKIDYLTPAEVVQIHGHIISTDIQKKILGGNEEWGEYVHGTGFIGNVSEVIQNNFTKPTRVPFAGALNYQQTLNFQNATGIPMGLMNRIDKSTGNVIQHDRFLPELNPNLAFSLNNTAYSKVLRSDFKHRSDMCVRTYVYFRAYDHIGYLTYKTNSGRVETVMVTEDILPDMLKELGIKQKYTESYSDIIKEDQLEENTLIWLLKPVTYRGIKIVSPLLEEPLYLECDPLEYQIKGDHMYDSVLPVSGLIGKSMAKKILSSQSGYNVCMNQVYNMLEKEVGIFFLVDVLSIPSNIPGWGDAKDALVNMRNMARDIGILPIQSKDANNQNNNFNTFGTYNLSYAAQVQYRLELAKKYQADAWAVLGVQPGMSAQPTTYETAEGVKVSQEARFSQLADFYETFDSSIQQDYINHLAVAQFAQSNKRDITVSYTKSDSSIGYLTFSDPYLNLRFLGLIPVHNRSKRKNLELFKTFVFQTNTLQQNILALAEFISSEDMNEALGIARKAEAQRQQDAQVVHDRELEVIELKDQKEAEKQKRDYFYKKDLQKDKIQGDIKESQINALGRAADKNSDENSFDTINETARLSLEKEQQENTNNLATRVEDRLDNEIKSKNELENKKLELKAKEIDAKLKISEDNKYVAGLNKN